LLRLERKNPIVAPSKVMTIPILSKGIIKSDKANGQEVTKKQLTFIGLNRIKMYKSVDCIEFRLNRLHFPKEEICKKVSRLHFTNFSLLDGSINL